ncbi:hypothetical protein BD289DRAFT_478948 [Coniella lustricola]|uniref:B30.2/SPRY domain-containing protein n=1 Tax=Coniella lustricola TaxID=2025994 RepID=A0A2T3AL30_9PEZI|nr:hypothetical protein BD289DRAFT_478948 [Coniella lustricola]
MSGDSPVDSLPNGGALQFSTAPVPSPATVAPPVPQQPQPQPQPPPVSQASAPSLPQKRALEDTHSPAVSSPLNPDPSVKRTQSVAEENTGTVGREKRTKKESLKKRESKAAAAASTGQGGGGGLESSRATPDPRQSSKKSSKNVPPAETSPARYMLPLPKASDFEPARGPQLASHHHVAGSDGEQIEFFETQEHVYNKKQYYYTHCIADPKFPSSFYYRQTEPEPFGPHMSFEDAATHLFFDRSARHITTDKGWRMSRANIAIRQGRWYWECKITRGILKEPPPPASEQQLDQQHAPIESHGHVRVGFARREAAIDAPAGFDAYSYGIRDRQGQKVYMSRPKDFFPPGQDLREGDVIGLEIGLPSEQLHRKVVAGHFNPAVDGLGDDQKEAADPVAVAAPSEAPNIVRDRLPIRFKAHIYFETPDYHTTPELDDLMNPSPMSASGAGAGGSGSGSGSGSFEGPNPNHPIPCLRTLPGSYIKVYKNGVDMGVAFTNLLAFLPTASKPATAKQPDAREGLDDGMLGYYPAVSVFRGGAAEVNFGPNFWYPPPGYGRERKADEDAKAYQDVVDGQEDVAMGGIDADTAAAATTSDRDHNNDGSNGTNTPAVAKPQEVTPPRPMVERYDEQIVEDVVYDIIDEVDFWMQDGAKVIDRSLRRGANEEVKEFKEVVQDV